RLQVPTGVRRRAGAFSTACAQTPLYDGQWHVYRVHIKLPAAKGDATGVFEFWLDGVLLNQVTGQTFISSKGVWSNRLDFVALGSNSNSGASQATSNWWGHFENLDLETSLGRVIWS